MKKNVEVSYWAKRTEQGSTTGISQPCVGMPVKWNESYIHIFLSVLLNCVECIKSSGYDGYLQALIKPQRLSRRVSETGIWEHFRTSFQSIQIAANNFLVLCDVLSLPAACSPTSTLSSQSYKCWKKSPEYMLRAYFKTQWFAVTVENILAVCYCVIEHVVCQWNVMHGSRPVDVRLKQ